MFVCVCVCVLVSYVNVRGSNLCTRTSVIYVFEKYEITVCFVQITVGNSSVARRMGSCFYNHGCLGGIPQLANGDHSGLHELSHMECSFPSHSCL